MRKIIKIIYGVKTKTVQPTTRAKKIANLANQAFSDNWLQTPRHVFASKLSQCFIVSIV